MIEKLFNEEDDFWEEISYQQLVKQSQKEDVIQKLAEQNKIMYSEDYTKFLKRRMDQTIDTMQKASRQHRKNALSLIKRRNQLGAKELLTKLNSEVDAKLESFNRTLDAMKTQVYRSQKQVDGIYCVIEQQYQITKRYWIYFLKDLELPKVSKLRINPIKLEKRELKIEKRALKESIETQKQVVQLYKDDYDRAYDKILIIKRSIQTQNSNHQTIIQTKQIEHKASNDAVLEQCSKIRRKYAKFAISSQLENQLMDELFRRQEQIINQLKKELESAKIVCKTPHIRFKLMSTLKSFTPDVTDRNYNQTQQVFRRPVISQMVRSKPKRNRFSHSVRGGSPLLDCVRNTFLL